MNIVLLILIASVVRLWIAHYNRWETIMIEVMDGNEIRLQIRRWNVFGKKWRVSKNNKVVSSGIDVEDGINEFDTILDYYTHG